MRTSWWWLSRFRLRVQKEVRAVEEFLERQGAKHRSTARFLGRRRALRVPSAEAGGGTWVIWPLLQSSSLRAT